MWDIETGPAPELDQLESGSAREVTDEMRLKELEDIIPRERSMCKLMKLWECVIILISNLKNWTISEEAARRRIHSREIFLLHE